MSDIEFDPDRHVAITKEQAAIYQRGMGVLNKMWTDPKDGLEFKRKVKKVEPTWAIPEVDVVEQAAAPFRAEIDTLKKSVTDLVDTIQGERKTAAEKAEERSLQERLDAAQREYRLTPEGMDKVVAHMKETGNPDPSSAAAWVTDHMPKAKPTSGSSNFGPTAMNLFGVKTQDESWKDLHTDPDGWFDREVESILNDPQFQAA